MKTFNMETPPASHQRIDASHAEIADSAWKPLFRVGGVAALIEVAFIVIAIPIFILWPPPGGLVPTSSTVIDCFTLIQKN